MFDYFKKFINSEQSGGIMLMICTIIALLLANSQISAEFFKFWETTLGFSANGYLYQKTIHHWINDGLMAVFFLLIGLEIKREIIEGELSTYQKAILPIFAAFGGMIFPALLFIITNLGQPTLSGWGIPTATDIAFSLAVLSLIKGVPKSLRIFLVALAVSDDIGAIILLAVFYAKTINLLFITTSIIMVLILFTLNHFKVKKTSFYIILGIILWVFVLNSGIHSTIAGVILAFAIPFDKDKRISPLHGLEEVLYTPVNFLILPLFALSNTGIILESNFIKSLSSPDSIGILLGLIIGKPLGILSFVFLSIKLKIAKLPSEIKLVHLLGVGFLCGIGYTMSIFISTLAYTNQGFIDSSKITVLVASCISAIIGLSILSLSKTKLIK
jgi:Na+:H+ antiporter, NhaA family